MIDVIIPVLNEENFLKENNEYFGRLNRAAHVIFVDGGSRDRTVELAKNYGDVICST